MTNPVRCVFVQVFSVHHHWVSDLVFSVWTDGWLTLFDLFDLSEPQTAGTATTPLPPSLPGPPSPSYWPQVRLLAIGSRFTGCMDSPPPGKEAGKSSRPSERTENHLGRRQPVMRGNVFPISLRYQPGLSSWLQTHRWRRILQVCLGNSSAALSPSVLEL